ncbi:MAG: GYDIA family GHMP kinase [Saprospiraceae bacterium]
MYAHGKLLLTGEYFVLDGALALAVPTRKGQSMHVVPRPTHPSCLHWESYTHDGICWFAAEWEWTGQALSLINTNDPATADRLVQLLQSIQQQGKQLPLGQSIRTTLEFPQDWGLGSSSTLVSLLAQHTDANPYTLLKDSFGGSGYDIACATAHTPILYQLKEGAPTVQPQSWEPAYYTHIYFVHLGQKQNSREGIRRYRELCGIQAGLIDAISDLTLQILEANNLTAAMDGWKQHEALVSQILQIPPVQTERFPDFPGQIKSLGAWGGDFVGVLSPWSPADTIHYFAHKGYPTLFTWEEMIHDEQIM